MATLYNKQNNMQIAYFKKFVVNRQLDKFGMFIRISLNSGDDKIQFEIKSSPPSGSKIKLYIFSETLVVMET